jgi:hypothetical protein
MGSYGGCGQDNVVDGGISDAAGEEMRCALQRPDP